MREPTGGVTALFSSSSIERSKLSVKLSDDSARRLSSGHGSSGCPGYTAYVGGKPLLASRTPHAFPSSASSSMPAEPRFKPSNSIHGSSNSTRNGAVRHNLAIHGSSNGNYSDHHHHQNHSSQPVERSKAYHHQSETEFLRKPISQAKTETTLEVADALPQWGRRKRSRCSRYDVSKQSLLARAKESASKVLLKVQGVGGLSSPSPSASPSRKASYSVVVNAHGGAKATPPSRNGTNGRTTAALSGSKINTAAASAICERQSGDEGGRAGGVATNSVNAGGAHHPKSRTSDAGVATTVDGHGGHAVKTVEWPRIVIGLTRKEKEDDFLIFKGTKLPQRPKKRPKAVERFIHYATPGSSLCELARGRYDVREKKCVKKRPRGLKAMESAESDSE